MESRIRYSSKRMDTNQPKVEANILLLGADSVGKSGEFVCFIKSNNQQYGISTLLFRI